jgi:alkyl hydroperoxide reductase subunit AhpC
MALIPRNPAPPLEADTLSGVRWTLSTQTPERFTLLVFYRGLHCPICRTHIGELDRLHEEFTRRGVTVVALSTDSREHATETPAKWA